MGLIDRMREAERKRRQRREVFNDVNDALLNAGEQVGRAISALRGRCPNCGAQYESHGAEEMIVVECERCTTRVTLVRS